MQDGIFYALLEDQALKFNILQSSSASLHQFAAHCDSWLNNAKWGMFWLHNDCTKGGGIPRKFDSDAYQAARELADLSDRYATFETAFTYASKGYVTIFVEGNTIRRSGDLTKEPCFAAYDRIVKPVEPPFNIVPVLRDIYDRIDRTLKISKGRFRYSLDYRLVNDAVSAFIPVVKDRLRLPHSWQFSRYSLNDFRQLSSILFAYSLIHSHARHIAMERGCDGLGFLDCIMVRRLEEWVQLLCRDSGLEENLVRVILSDLTYGNGNMRAPDIALQPFVPLLPDTLGLSPHVVLTSDLERNFSVLLNRLPEDKKMYAQLSDELEQKSRQKIQETLKGNEWRFWNGPLPGHPELPDIDLAIVSDAQKVCLILEIKSFIGPAEAREVIEKFEHIIKGIKQIQQLKRSAKVDFSVYEQALSIDSSFLVTWAVASETSIGLGAVQDDEVPVVLIPHFIRKALKTSDLRKMCDWLNQRTYLPKEGVDFEVVEQPIMIGKWTLEWYGLKIHSENVF
jgi:hypothetical protein